MESKHMYFKRCIRTMHNFINVTKTVSETPQLNQAFLSTALLLRDFAEPGRDCVPFDDKVFAHSIINSVSQCAQLTKPLQVSPMATVKGTDYSTGLFVVIDYVESQPSFGRDVTCVLDSQGKCGLAVAVPTTVRKHDLGVYVASECEEIECFKCIPTDELWDYCPLPSYMINGMPHIALKHALFDNAA
jgi:hypothetical protein